jgi:hypothetical protein
MSYSDIPKIHGVTPQKKLMPIFTAARISELSTRIYFNRNLSEGNFVCKRQNFLLLIEYKEISNFFTFFFV